MWRETSNAKERRLTPMCVQNNCRGARQAVQPDNSCCCCRPRCCCCSCGCQESTAPTATISMADYEPFILVPTSVFDQGDEGCGCGFDW